MMTWRIGRLLIVGDHKVSEVICLNCYRRWLAARPVDVKLYDLKCPQCGTVGGAIETGETCIGDDLLKQAMKE